MSVNLLRRFITEVLNGFAPTGGLKNTAPGNVRYDVPVRPTSHAGVLDDSSENDQGTLHAACCLVRSDDGKILAVSRKNDPTDWGLPGGKVDPGETPEQAAARELTEETGLKVVRSSPVFSMLDAQDYVTTTFACEVEGSINTDESGLVRWVTPDVMLNGSFNDYLTKLFSKLNIK